MTEPEEMIPEEPKSLWETNPALVELMAQDTLAPVGNMGLKEMTQFAQHQIKLEDEVEKLTEQLDELKERLAQVKNQDLPDLMRQLRMQDFTLTTGEKITIKEELKCGISDDNRPAAYAWIRANGGGPLIKSVLVVEVQKARNQEELDQIEEKVVKIEEKIKEGGFKSIRDETIHAQTLKAFVNEKNSKGVPIDRKALGVFDFRESKIKRKK